MEETFEEMIKITSEKSIEIGILKERDRILGEILKINLPVGIWSQYLEKIICPEK